MAQTKIWPVKHNLARCIRSVMNPAKTQDGKLASIIVERVCTLGKAIRADAAEYPAERMRNRFLKLDSGHIEYAADCHEHKTNKDGDLAAQRELVTRKIQLNRFINYLYTRHVITDVKKHSRADGAFRQGYPEGIG